MIRVEAVVTQVHGVARADLDDWVARGWIVPQGRQPDWIFTETDISRVRLVRDLRHDAGIGEDSLAVVLSLLDQIADLRHALHGVAEAMTELPPDTRARLLSRLRPRSAT